MLMQIKLGADSEHRSPYQHSPKLAEYQSVPWLLPTTTINNGTMVKPGGMSPGAYLDLSSIERLKQQAKQFRSFGMIILYWIMCRLESKSRPSSGSGTWSAASSTGRRLDGRTQLTRPMARIPTSSANCNMLVGRSLIQCIAQVGSVAQDPS